MRAPDAATGGSTGLGLAIVAAVVDAHHGTVTVTSQPGHTQFTVRLPLAQLAPAPYPGPGPQMSPALSGAQVGITRSETGPIA